MVDLNTYRILSMIEIEGHMLIRTIASILVVASAMFTVACESADTSELQANAHRARGYEANERGDWSVAVTEYAQAIELDATADDYAERAYAYAGLGDTRAAISDFTASIELDPQSAAAYSQRALLYNELGRWTEAVEDLDRAIELRPDRADQYNGRAFAHMNLGNWDKVVSDASRVLEVAEGDDPIIPIYLSNRSSAYAELGDYELALADIERAIEFDPDNFTSQQNRLVLLVEAGRVDDARAAAAALAPGWGLPPAAVNLLMADVLRAAGRMEEALGELDEAIELDPGSAILLIARATTYEDLGDLVAACSDFRSARDLAPDDAFRGEVAAALDRLRRAGACPDQA